MVGTKKYFLSFRVYSSIFLLWHHFAPNILELTRDFKTSRRLPEFRQLLDNMSLVTLVTNFSQSPTFAESDPYFKILKPLAYILSTKNFLTCLNGPQGRNIPPLMSSRIKLQWTLRTWMKFIFKLALSTTPTNSLKVSSSTLPPPPSPLLPRFLLRKHKHHVTTVGNINQITTYFGRLLS